MEYMEISNHSLPQITPEVLKKLTSEELLQLSIKMLKDLKELHDRLNQNSNNSSRPPSSISPWEKNRLDENNSHSENAPPERGEAQAEKENKTSNQNDLSHELNSNDISASIKNMKESFSKNKNVEESVRKKPGKQKGSPGYGRTWNPEVTEEAVHCALDACIVCNCLLDPTNNTP